MAAKKVAIIGGGVSGITAVKACIEEKLDVVCFERTSEIGGLWRYTEEADENRGCVMKSTIINTSKELSAFSDFPPPADFPNFMHNSKMIKYLDMYADEFGVRPHIKVRHEVISVSPVVDGTERWTVRVENLQNNEKSEDVYDGVVVCTGHHCFPQIPNFPDQEKFKGRILHTRDYKKPSGFEGRQVCVVGVGNSGLDAAVELSSVAGQVYMSTRRGAWVMPRVGANGWPYDLGALTRLNQFLFDKLPYGLVCWAFEREADQRFDHELYNMKPRHRIFGQHPVMNDSLPNRILSGTVKVMGNIKQFTERGIVFEDDTAETPVDDVIFATGYKIQFPFFEEEIVECNDNNIDLFKMVFHPKYPTLAFVGLVEPLGALMPLSELQSRWIARVFNGKLSLPPASEMFEDIERYKNTVRARFYDGSRNTLEADWIPYMDSLASLVGVKPNLVKLFFADHTLWRKIFLGASLPYQYRLEGPGKWPEARKTLLESELRVRATLQTRNKYDSSQQREDSTSSLMKIALSLSIAMMIALVALTR